MKNKGYYPDGDATVILFELWAKPSKLLSTTYEAWFKIGIYTTQAQAELEAKPLINSAKVKSVKIVRRISVTTVKRRIVKQWQLKN